MPAVLDYPNHLARFYILAHPDDPILAKMYAPHWGHPAQRRHGPDRPGADAGAGADAVAGRIVLALSLLAPPAGVALYARAALGRWTWWSLGAGVVAYNGIFFLGFMNFLLGLGMGLAAAAAWVVAGGGRGATRPPWRSARGVLGLCAFFCHLLGYGLFALLIVAREAEPLAWWSSGSGPAAARPGRRHRRRRGAAGPAPGAHRPALRPHPAQSPTSAARRHRLELAWPRPPSG